MLRWSASGGYPTGPAEGEVHFLLGIRMIFLEGVSLLDESLLQCLDHYKYSYTSAQAVCDWGDSLEY